MEIMINNFIPSSIINLCFKFYHIPRDEWDKKLTKALFDINQNEITNIHGLYLDVMLFAEKNINKPYDNKRKHVKPRVDPLMHTASNEQENY